MKWTTTISVVVACFLLGSVLSAQDWARKQLNESPRHHEWVQIKYDKRTVRAFLVYPEVETRAMAIVVIHENRGLTDWVRSVADQLAAEGYIAVAPDLLSGMGPEGGGTEAFADQNAARDALYNLSPEQIRNDLNAVTDYVRRLDACNGRVAVAGFCWGGRQTFLFATQRPDLAAAFVFYGTPPEDDAALKRIQCPVYGFYGERDARVTATVEKTQARMKAAGKAYFPVIYKAARHGFMRVGEEPGADEANKTARQEAWKRWMQVLAELQKTAG